MIPNFIDEEFTHQLLVIYDEISQMKVVRMTKFPRRPICMDCDSLVISVLAG